MSWYRVQSADRDTADLLDPEQQWSESYCTDRVRHGVSVCGDLDTLADYLAETGIPFDETWVLVELDGCLSDEQDEDHHLGCRLVLPDEIIKVSAIAPVLDRIYEILDAA